MALPPEPLDTLLSRAMTVVIARVVSVSTSPATRPLPSHWPIGLGPRLPAATAQLHVEKVLKGSAPDELEVLKPESTYALAVGHHGAFLLDAERQILGRHGPDNYSVAALSEALAKGGR